MAVLVFLSVAMGACRGAPLGEADSVDVMGPAVSASPSIGDHASESAQTADSAPATQTRLDPFPGVVILLDEPAVELVAWVCIEGGWLEQIACSPGTREHESLLVPQARPSRIHAALLMAGFEPGSPGRWSCENGEYSFVPPTGAALSVHVRYEDEAGRMIEEPIRAWIRDHDDRCEFPGDPWIFAGSCLRPNTETMGPGEHYVADITGSNIGLVTFGDEVIGFSRVLADQAAVHPPQWEVDAERIPPVGTKITLILRPARAEER